MLDLMSDDHVTGDAALFWQKNMKNYNLILAKRIILNIYLSLLKFREREIYL